MSTTFHSTKLKVLGCEKVVGPNSALEVIKRSVTMSKQAMLWCRGIYLHSIKCIHKIIHTKFTKAKWSSTCMIRVCARWQKRNLNGTSPGRWTRVNSHQCDSTQTCRSVAWQITGKDTRVFSNFKSAEENISAERSSASHIIFTCQIDLMKVSGSSFLSLSSY